MLSYSFCTKKKETKQVLDREGRARAGAGTSFARLLGPAPAGGEWTGRTRWGTAPPPPPPQRLGLACLLSKTRPLLFVCTAGRAAVPQRDRRHGHSMMSRAGCTVPCWLLLGHLAFLFAFPEWSGTANNPCPSASTFFFPPFGACLFLAVQFSPVVCSPVAAGLTFPSSLVVFLPRPRRRCLLLKKATMEPELAPSAHAMSERDN